MTLQHDSQNNVRFLPFAKPDEGHGSRENDSSERTTPAVEVGKSLAELVEAFSKLDAWKGVLAWNEFTHRIVFRREAPFGDVVRLGDHLRDEDVVRMRLWFQTEHGVQVSGANVLDAVRVVAWRNRFSPLREYVS